MNTEADYIKNRLSLRDPLRESLDILVTLAEELSLEKEVDLAVELEKVASLYPSCTDFERAFPSLCFSIATGVGKTRLMGAFVTYLYKVKGIRNFFILAPNLTIYEKLITDFGEPGSAKYVFKGISDFVHNRPVIITGDNYDQQGQLFSADEVRINIFNISKFNRDAGKPRSKKDKGKPPRIKRLSEHLGESYWSYLSGVKDLVVLMDEAHRYHAASSKAAIDELSPILGLELTATPIDEKGKSFKNVVYEYSLARALADGKYVKNPAIATRKNFRPKGLTAEEIEKIKLEDAISIHEDTKNELEVYAATFGVKKVKPFVFVVCRDIAHAKQTKDYMTSTSFYQGKYSNKVLQIDSSTKKDEDVDRQFVELEQYDNDIEIVIHVNMLKEGWDVNNLYTIVPIRKADAITLIEQTIGRGLRLPYNGQRTGVDKVDKLTVVAHDNFEKIIEAAQDPDSILNKMSTIEIDPDDLTEKTEVITAESKLEVEVRHEEERISTITNDKERQAAKNTLDAKKAIIHVLPSFNSTAGVRSVEDLSKKEVKQAVMKRVKADLQQRAGLFSEQVVAEAEASYDDVVSSYKEHIIEIPRITLTLGTVDVWFDDFDLDTSKGFDFDLLGEEIMVVELTGERKTDNVGVQFGAFSLETPVNQIVNEVINYDEISYDDNSDLLFKLSGQAVAHLEANINVSGDLPLLVRQYRKIIADIIYSQMMDHFQTSEPEYGESTVQPFVRIEPWNFSALPDDKRHHTDVISPLRLIPKLVFSGFEKACHFEYKFDSKTEKDFATLLENDETVIRWMRPSQRQFNIYWDKTSRTYQPDFVVETAKCIYLAETKASNELESPEVLSKMKAALTYCSRASTFTAEYGGKPWRYLLIPHDEVNQSTTLEYFCSRYMHEEGPE